MMNRSFLRLAGPVAFAAMSLAAAACTTDLPIDGSGGSAAALHGKQGGGSLAAAAGKTAPASAVVQVVWEVSSGSPDYKYAFGKGEVSNGSYDLTLADPPDAALNSYGIGVGILTLLPEGGGVADGKIADATAFEAQALGATGDYAIIYKKAGAVGNSWSGAFPDGYSCAKGVPPAAGEKFASFAPVACSEIVITVDAIANITFTNWT